MTEHFDDLLDDFLDGTISEVNECVLFDLIEGDHELRRHFISGLRAHRSAQLLSIAAAPSSHVTEQVFARISHTHASAGPLHSALKPVLLTFSALVVLGIVFVGGIRIGQGLKYPRVVRSSPPPPIGASPVVAVSTPSVSSVHIVQDDGIAASDARISTRDNVEIISRSNEAPTAFHTQTTLQRNPHIYPPTDMALYSDHASGIESTSLSLHVRTIQSIGVPAAGLSTNDRSGLTNLAMNALFNVGEGIDVGVELGRQAFLQEYQQQSGSVTERVRQYPTLYWAGPAVRFTLRDAIADHVSPYGQVSAGAGNGGIIGRALVGVSWQPVDRIALTSSAEVGNLWYTANNALNTSAQFNWSIGVGITW